MGEWRHWAGHRCVVREQHPAHALQTRRGCAPAIGGEPQIGMVFQSHPLSQAYGRSLCRSRHAVPYGHSCGSAPAHPEQLSHVEYRRRNHRARRLKPRSCGKCASSPLSTRSKQSCVMELTGSAAPYRTPQIEALNPKADHAGRVHDLPDGAHKSPRDLFLRFLSSQIHPRQVSQWGTC